MIVPNSDDALTVAKNEFMAYAYVLSTIYSKIAAIRLYFFTKANVLLKKFLCMFYVVQS